MLGGFVGADLDYNQLARGFDFEGGRSAATPPISDGGLFVDTLLNAHLLELETATLGFPSSLDATTVGLRTDTGYRFGSFNGGAFIEPLATLAVLWSDIDGFSRGGNTVSFDDEANVRGRLGVASGHQLSDLGHDHRGAVRHRQPVGQSLAATIRRHWSPPAPPSVSRTISTTCGARSRPE